MDKETKKEFENLAKIVKKGFDDVDQRFEQVDQRFEDIENRMATKEELKEVKDEMATKKDLNSMKLELMDHTEEKAADVKGSLVVSIRKQD